MSRLTLVESSLEFRIGAMGLRACSLSSCSQAFRCLLELGVECLIEERCSKITFLR